MEYYLVLKRNELLDMKKHVGNLNAYLKKPMWKCQSTYWMISTIWDSGKGRTIGTLKIPVVAMGSARGKKGWICATQGTWGTVKLYYMIM